MKHLLDWKNYATVARQAVAEGCVMVRNENQTLPLPKNSNIAIFGRMQFHYIKSGTGSGGLVNAPYVVSILDALESCADIKLNLDLLETYKSWITSHPFDYGQGWAQEPWAQEEMILTEEIVHHASKESDIAIVIIGRQAGEDRDNGNASGSYLLTPEEEIMLSLTTKHFSKVVVLLNVGNIIDMKWVETYQPDSVLYVWQGGCEGGNGVLDILTGATTPSGRLTDTIAKDIADYPSTENFGNPLDNYYQEDIYVGYRYFETFAKDKVLYPFGFGLSYTKFHMECTKMSMSDNRVTLDITVTNIGNASGKEVVQVYINPPQGALGKPLRNLVAFAKTRTLTSNESQQISLEFALTDFASYDDSGVTGHKNSYVLEEGGYECFLGSDVRSAQLIGSVSLHELQVVESLTQACAPTKEFQRLKPLITTSGLDNSINASYEPTPLRSSRYTTFSENNKVSSLSYTGNQGYQLCDVRDQKITLDQFIAQLTDEELIHMTRGEGMCSPKVTPGTAAAFGGVTNNLLAYGIPLACCADGPSGIRLDSGSMAFSLPNGTSLASSFNVELCGELFDYLGMELSFNHVDTLLGPGINIHRNPLNGRNFEYFSEDPYLTGTMAIAQLQALHSYHVTGTIKHFACNNQEYERSNSNSIVSERALREIYLKGYEMAVKQAGAYSIMSTYGALNGIWTASSYDLLTTILREEWNFNGIVMTDWWAKMNNEGEEATMTNTLAMIRAQNDVYMVVECAETNSLKDKTQEALDQGLVTRNLLARGAKNICKFLLNSRTLSRYTNEMDLEINIEELGRWEMEESRCTLLPPVHAIQEATIIPCDNVDTSKGASAKFFIQTSGTYQMDIQVSADVQGIAQVPMTVYCGHKAVRMLTLNKEHCQNICITITDLIIDIPSNQEDMNDSKNNYIKLFFAEGGIRIDKLILRNMY